MTTPFEQRLQLEAKVKEYLTLGLSTRDIAKRLGNSQQSTQRYLARRGWKTAATLTEGELIDEVTRLMREGLSIDDIAHRVGRTAAVIKTMLKN
jgi:transposase